MLRSTVVLFVSDYKALKTHMPKTVNEIIQEGLLHKQDDPCKRRFLEKNSLTILVISVHTSAIVQLEKLVTNSPIYSIRIPNIQKKEMIRQELAPTSFRTSPPDNIRKIIWIY